MRRRSGAPARAPIDLAALPTARLAPDMFPLTKQVQIACDHAKDATARLIGQEPPRFENDEHTLDDLKARIAKTIDYVQSARAAAFEGAEDRAISPADREPGIRLERL
jgi:uncharacterized protein